ncbi:MAG: protein kinase [Bacteroides sp.]|nr:protein kinase [Bacteroides sp.]
MSDNSQNKVDKTERWTEIEHLTEWDEEFYNVFTAKKFGKWVMLKTLRPELKDDPKYQAMIEKEFDVRYNLSHPNIVMINDFEDVPGIGRCIITDDVYGLSLRKIIDQGKISAHHLDQLITRLPAAMAYIQTNHLVHHPIRPETIIFTENIENLKLIDVGFDQRENLTPTDVAEDIYRFGITMREVLDKSGLGTPQLRHVVARCLSPNPRNRYRSVADLQLALQGRSLKRVLFFAAAFVAVMALILVLINLKLIG